MYYSDDHHVYGDGDYGDARNRSTPTFVPSQLEQTVSVSFVQWRAVASCSLKNNSRGELPASLKASSNSPSRLKYTQKCLRAVGNMFLEHHIAADFFLC